MQGLTDSPRGALTAAQVTALLTGNTLTVSAGLELLDGSNNLIQDVSDDLAGGTISRDNYADVHGSCNLQIARSLVWGKDRVRPYMTLSGAGVTARFNLGVYVLTTPDTKRGETPITYDVFGYDLLYLLQDGPGDTYVVTAGTTYLTAVQAVVTASGVGAAVYLDGTKQTTAVPVDMVWALDGQGAPSWLEIINDLLAAIGYIGIWADQNGALRSGPYAAPANRASEWLFDTSNAATNIVGQDRTLSEDVWAAPNRWRFVRTDMATQPTEGAGLYTVNNVHDGPASQDSLGRIRTKVVYLDAADQASLVAQGDKIVAEDRQVTRTFSISIDPLPILGHRDVVTLTDAGDTDKIEVASWELRLDGGQGSLDLGLGKSDSPGPQESMTKATVTQASPLKVVVDGATVASKAKVLDAAAYTVGDRVTVTVRNPLQPLVQGKES